jgi:murein DD-endopeptidase MepM/ murein hydrolase activator NlpD
VNPKLESDMKLFRLLTQLLLLCVLASCSHTKGVVAGSRDGCYPLPGAKVISPYKNNSGSHRHTGVDLKTKANDPIYAVGDGVVTMSKNYSGYGKCIIIKHADGTETLYAHNSKNYVKEGEKVKSGQKIALTGRTGRATTEHLHFEVRKNGKPVNPMPLLEKLSKKSRLK